MEKVFSVVADEVLKLAEQSRIEYGNIQELIREMQNETKNAILSMEKKQ
ncbi:hypothetical protein [Alkalihalobacillus deserti]|nr:hypothetical protein [Alkalihalobacillus deserti]